MLDRVGGRFHLHDHSGSQGDTVYGAVRLLRKWLVDRKITPRTSRCGTSRRVLSGTFSRADFVFDQRRNVYICPGGKAAACHRNGHRRPGTLRYRASKVDCDVCAFKMRCCPSTPMHDMSLAICTRMPAMSPARPGQDRGLRTIASGSAKGRDAVCAHEVRIFKLDRLRLRRPERR